MANYWFLVRSLIFSLCDQDAPFPVSSTKSCLGDKAALAQSKGQTFWRFKEQDVQRLLLFWDGGSNSLLKWLHLHNFSYSPFLLRSFLESIADQPLESNTDLLLKALWICYQEDSFQYIMSHVGGKVVSLGVLGHIWVTRAPEQREALLSCLKVNICSSFRFFMWSLIGLSDYLKALNDH